MKKKVGLFLLLGFFGINICFAQFGTRVPNSIDKDNAQEMYNRIYNSGNVQKPPVFTFGKDSAQRFYLNHFGGFEKIVTKCIAMGDTGKYIRVNFSFIVDKKGVVQEPKFEKVSATSYEKSAGSKTLKYFYEQKKELNDIIKVMVQKMPLWKPALENLVPVECEMQDYVQFWVGINPPPSN